MSPRTNPKFISLHVECLHCDESQSVGDIVEAHRVAKGHERFCPNHPMRALEAQLAHAEQQALAGSAQIAGLLAVSQAEAARYRAAFDRYRGHLSECSGRSGQLACNCGLTETVAALLRTPPPADESASLRAQVERLTEGIFDALSHTNDDCRCTSISQCETERERSLRGAIDTLAATPAAPKPDAEAKCDHTRNLRKACPECASPIPAEAKCARCHGDGFSECRCEPTTPTPAAPDVKAPQTCEAMIETGRDPVPCARKAGHAPPCVAGYERARSSDTTDEVKSLRAEVERLKEREPTQDEMRAEWDSGRRAPGQADTAFLHGTIRLCRECQRFVFGGPTRCEPCAAKVHLRAELDKAKADLARVTAERDEARAEATAYRDAYNADVERVKSERKAALDERDAIAEKVRAAVDGWDHADACSRRMPCDDIGEGDECPEHGRDGCPPCECVLGEVLAALDLKAVAP